VIRSDLGEHVGAEHVAAEHVDALRLERNRPGVDFEREAGRRLALALAARPRMADESDDPHRRRLRSRRLRRVPGNREQERRDDARYCVTAGAPTQRSPCFAGRHPPIGLTGAVSPSSR